MISRRQFFMAAGSTVISAGLPCTAVAGSKPLGHPAANDAQRHVALMVESSGLSPDEGHRIVEVSAVEVINREYTGRYFHEFIDPERGICPGAESVHGLSRKFLSGMPKFADIANDLLRCIGDADVLTHGANFHIGFLDAEFARLGIQPLQGNGRVVTDTLCMARELFPDERNGLEELYERLNLDPWNRDPPMNAWHVATVYRAMTERYWRSE